MAGMTKQSTITRIDDLETYLAEIPAAFSGYGDWVSGGSNVYNKTNIVVQQDSLSNWVPAVGTLDNTSGNWTTSNPHYLVPTSGWYLVGMKVKHKCPITNISNNWGCGFLVNDSNSPWYADDTQGDGSNTANLYHISNQLVKAVYMTAGTRLHFASFSNLTIASVPQSYVDWVFVTALGNNY